MISEKIDKNDRSKSLHNHVGQSALIINDSFSVKHLFTNTSFLLLIQIRPSLDTHGGSCLHN